MNTTDGLQPGWRAWGPAWLLLVLVLGFAWLFHDILLPFLLAMFVVYLMEPVVGRLTRVRWGRWAFSRFGAVVLVYLLAFGAVGSFGTLLAMRLQGELVTLVTETPEMLRQLREERLPRINRMMDRMLTWMDLAELEPPDDQAASPAWAPPAEDAPAEGIERSVPRGLLVVPAGEPGEGWEVRWPLDGMHVEPLANGAWRVSQGTVTAPVLPVVLRPRQFDLEVMLTESLRWGEGTSRSQLTWMVELLQRLLEGFVSIMTTGFLTLMVAAFLSSDLPRYLDYFYGLIPPHRRTQARRLLVTLNDGLSGVIRGQLMICLVNGVLTGVGLALLGVKYAVLLGLMAGVLSIIPIFGTILSTVPAVAVGLTQSPMTALLVLGWILFIHFVEANVLNPKIMGDNAHISPVLVVFALLAGEHSFGLTGALLAVPVASIVQSLYLFTRAVLEESVPQPEPAGSAQEPS
jgi:predicted PurR-regulated permease PerM